MSSKFNVVEFVVMETAAKWFLFILHTYGTGPALINRGPRKSRLDRGDTRKLLTVRAFIISAGSG